MIDTPLVTETEEQFAAVIDLDVPRAQMASAFEPAVREILAALAAQGVKPHSAAFAHHLRRSPDRFNFELGFMTAQPVAPVSRVKPEEVPALQVARTVYHGPYEGLPAAWAEFDAWMRKEGLRQAEDLWEIYTYGPHMDPDPRMWWTELVRPLAG